MPPESISAVPYNRVETSTFMPLKQGDYLLSESIVNRDGDMRSFGQDKTNRRHGIKRIGIILQKTYFPGQVIRIALFDTDKLFTGLK